MPRCCFEKWDFEDLVGFPFFKCDEIRLSWVLTVKTTVILLKISLNSCLLGLHQLYTGRAGGSSRGNGFNIIFSNLSQCVQRGLVVTLWPSVLKVLSWITGSTCFSFSSCLVFLLVIAVLFFFFIYSYFFQIYKFSSLLPYFPFNSASCHFPEVLRKVVRFTYF